MVTEALPIMRAKSRLAPESAPPALLAELIGDCTAGPVQYKGQDNRTIHATRGRVVVGGSVAEDCLLSRYSFEL